MKTGDFAILMNAIDGHIAVSAFYIEAIVSQSIVSFDSSGKEVTYENLQDGKAFFHRIALHFIVFFKFVK